MDLFFFFVLFFVDFFFLVISTTFLCIRSMRIDSLSAVNRKIRCVKSLSIHNTISCLVLSFQWLSPFYFFSFFFFRPCTTLCMQAELSLNVQDGVTVINHSNKIPVTGRWKCAIPTLPHSQKPGGINEVALSRSFFYLPDKRVRTHACIGVHTRTHTHAGSL